MVTISRQAVATERDGETRNTHDEQKIHETQEYPLCKRQGGQNRPFGHAEALCVNPSHICTGRAQFRRRIRDLKLNVLIDEIDSHIFGTSTHDGEIQTSLRDGLLLVCTHKNDCDARLFPTRE